jgi:glycosyltransferase involved in cell wall biosynthesis
MIKFNIVIPTRERADTLYWSLKSCVNQKYENLTIWVSDNCSIDNTEEVVKSFSDKRIRYIKTPERVSMSHNWEFALSHIEEGFVTYIGDDDALLPDAFEFASKLLEENKVDALSFGSATYYWPQVGEEAARGVLNVPRGNLFSIRNAFADLKKTARDIFSSVQLPGLYWGVVNIQVLKKIQAINGVFFQSISPDVYSAIVVASFIDTYLYCERPIILRGFSKHSTGVSCVNSEFDQAPIQLFMKEANLPIHEKLVSAPSLAIGLADCILQSARLNPKIPEVSLYTVIEKAAFDAMHATNKEKYEEIIAGMRVIGEKNKMKSYAERIISKLAYPERVVSSELLPNTDNSSFQIKTLQLNDSIGLKVSNVFEASLLAGQFVMPFAVNKKDLAWSLKNSIRAELHSMTQMLKSRIIRLMH